VSNARPRRPHAAGRLPSAGVLALAASLALALLAAAPLHAEEWFDAYQKGERALRQGKGVDAVVLLERAAQKRPEPGNNLITYGTNRIEKYHPYLRLAEAYLLVGDVQAAREALRRSELRGKEPAAERARLQAAVESATRKTAEAAPATPAPAPVATPLPMPAATPVPATPPPTTAPAHPAPAPAIQPTATPTPPSRPVATAPPALGTLDLGSDPAGAAALIGTRLLGTTPLRVELGAGEYSITLRREGRADLQFQVRIVAGRVTRETRTLQPVAAPAARAEPAGAAAGLVPATGSILLVSDPPGASAYLDDEFVGTTDPRSGRLAKTGVAAGRHRLRVALADREPFEQEVDVRAGRASEVQARLAAAEQAASFLPWVSAGAVLVLVGGLVVAMRRRRADQESTRAMPAADATRTRVASAPSPARTPPARTPATPAAAGRSPDRPKPGGPLTPKPGERFGDYVLQAQLGRGGMAAVYEAERGGEVCALKRPLPMLLEDPEFLERFLREAELGRTLHHPNIIRIFERGEVEGLPYFTMELVRGETLHARIKREGALAPREATRIIVQVAEALDYAHLKGVIHRDLKPSNVMLLEDGTVKVMDYGIARARRFEGLTVTGAFLGTPDYVAPETAEGKPTDGRSDLYSLGVVFYEALTGKRPFVGQTPFETLKKHCSEAPTPPSVVSPDCPRELEAIVLKLLRKEPDERYANAEDLLVELRAFLNRPS
jgi:hypothetical protein